MKRTGGDVLQGALVKLLRDGETSLRVDGRAVKVLDLWPGERFGQRGLPAVVVERPSMESDVAWCGMRRQVWDVPMGLVDGRGVRARTKEDGEQRVGLLLQRVMGYLQGDEVTDHWWMPFLHVYRDDCEWSFPGEARPLGKNLWMWPLTLSVPMLVESGKVWDDDELPEGVL